MKTKYKFLILVLQILSLSAQADEDLWAGDAFVVARSQSQLIGFQTDRQTFRISEVRSGLSGLAIAGGILPFDPQMSEKRCLGYGNSLRKIKELMKHSYRLSGFVFPLATDELRKLNLVVENMPVISTIEVQLVPKVQSPVVTQQSAQEFQELFKQQIENQIDKLQKTGEISMDLIGVDDVVCDLITGQVELTVRFGLSLELAKHERQSIISVDEFRRVYESLKKKKGNVKSSSLVHIMNGAQLLQALEKESSLDTKELDVNKFLRIAEVLYDSSNGSLKSYSSAQVASVARSTDILKIYSTMIPYSHKFNAMAAGKQ